MLHDEPRPEIARSAVILGEVHVGAGAILAQGLVVRAHGAAVSIGNYSAILENGVVIGTAKHPVRVGQRTVFGHRAAIVGAVVGDLCEIGNGAILMPGSLLGSGCILGEGTLVPPGTVIPAGTVLVGRPPQVIRPATDADRAGPCLPTPSQPCAGCNGDRNGRKKTPQQPTAPLLDQALSSSRIRAHTRRRQPERRRHDLLH